MWFQFMNMKREKIIRIIIYVVLILFVAGFLIATFFPGIIEAWKDKLDSGEDICKPQPGYTEEEWREHMGHHPDIYKRCLT